MSVDDTRGSQPLNSPSYAGSATQYASNPNSDSKGDAAHTSEVDHKNRSSQETLRREPPDSESLILPNSHEPTSYHVLTDNNVASRSGLNEDPAPAEYHGEMPSPELDDLSASHSRESTAEPPTRHQRNGNTSVDDDEDVWEDEEDSILMDENGNVVYDGPNYEDSASDVSDDADAEDLNQHRRSYRAATQEYRKSRRALLLSGMSSFASSPSSDGLDTGSPILKDDGAASPPESLYEKDRQQDRSDSYYQPHTAEAVDNAETGGRATDIKYDYDSDKEAAAKSESRRPSASRLKQEHEDSFDDSESHPIDAVDTGSPRTPRALKAEDDDPLGSMTNGGGTERLVRPDPSPRTMSLADVNPATPSSAHRQPELNSFGLRERRSFGGLAPSPLIFENELQEPLEAYMTPRLSLATLHEEPRVAPPPAAREEKTEKVHNQNGKAKRDSQSDPNGTPATSRPDTTPFSLWDYLKEEVLATDFDATQEMKWERVTNFISIPFWMEKIIMFGFVVCLDSFLYTFTILPLRFGVAMWVWVGNSARWILGGQKRYLHSSQKCDILKMLLIVLSCVILSRITDASKMYHSVRGQDVVKLSVIFNVLEIADRLCCSFGQDLLDSLFSRSTLARRKNGKQPYLRPIGFFGLSLCYVLAHTLVLFYQLVTLNVAINSYDNALLTLLLSNQFVEIKSSVFKKFEKENVFQMTCADIVERFQLTLMLSAIGLRNLIELSGGSLEPSASPLPASFTVFPSLSLLETVLTPVCIVLASECIVDWLKHAFITKFNHIRPAVYGRFMDVLCRDLVVGGPSIKENSRKHTFVDQSPIISRRLGFAALPLACLLVRLILQIMGMIGDTSHIDECIAPINPRISETGWIGTVARKLGANDINNDWVRALDLFVRGSAWALTLAIAWVFLVAIKLLLGTYLVGFASHRYATMHERENEENLNAKDRAPIGTNKDERSYDKSLSQFIDKADDDAIQIKLDGTHVLPAPKDKTKKEGEGQQQQPPKPKKESSLMEVSRYNMVRSRIW